MPFVRRTGFVDILVDHGIPTPTPISLAQIDTSETDQGTPNRVSTPGPRFSCSRA